PPPRRTPGEPTEGKIVLGHFGSLWLRISTRGNFVHTAFSEGKRDQNSLVRMHDVLGAVLEWIPTWEEDESNSYRGAKAIVNVSALSGGFGGRVSRRARRGCGLARLPHAAPRRPLPRRARPADEGDGGRAARGAGDGARPCRAL